MTALHDLRTEAQNHPEGSAARRLMTWAEIHIGDQFDAITEMESDNQRMRSECATLRKALQAIETAAAELAEHARAAAYRVPDDALGKDIAPWTNLLAAHGLKPDGTARKTRTQKRAA